MLFLVFVSCTVLIVTSRQLNYRNLTVKAFPNYHDPLPGWDLSVSANTLSDAVLGRPFSKLTVADQTVPLLSFGPFGRLKVLRVRETRTAELRSGTFRTFPRLRVLEFTGNPLKSLPGDVFELPRLVKLNLGSNELEDLDEYAFTGLPSLEFLFLDRNRLKGIEPSWFLRLPTLRNVNLNRNLLENVPEGAFKYVLGRSDPSYCKDPLLDVSLMYNGLKKFSDLAFADRAKIGNLMLRGNQLERLTLGNVEKVVWLDMSENNVTCLGFENLPRVGVIVADENPWDCKCLSDLLENKERKIFANRDRLGCLIDETSTK